MLKNPLTCTSYPESFIAESIVNPLNLTKIKEKIDKYTSFDQFLADIQWITHNCFILFLGNHLDNHFCSISSTDTTNSRYLILFQDRKKIFEEFFLLIFIYKNKLHQCKAHLKHLFMLNLLIYCHFYLADNKDKMEIAKSLVDYLEVEIESVKKCAECYSNEYKYPDTYFTMVCNEPHLIVWAKKTGFNFWPAKLMSIDGQLINVSNFHMINLWMCCFLGDLL